MFLRKFIILNKQDSKNEKGHVKLEVRGTKARLSLTVEGAEKSDDSVYKLYIVSDESNNFTEVELGRVEIDRGGRGKLDLGFNSDSVGKSNLDIEKFNILVLKREDSSKSTSQVALGGYIHKDDESLSKLKKEKKIKSNSEEKEEKIESLDKDNSETLKIQRKINKVKTQIEEQGVEEVKEVKIPNKNKQQDIKENIETTKEIDKEENKEIEVEELESYIKSCKEYGVYESDIKSNFKHYSNQVASYTLDILKFFKRVNPFKIEFENYMWWKIDYDKMNSHRGFLPYYSYILNSNYQNRQGRFATCHGQIKKHKHYLFGMVEDKGNITHYVYAIPGKYERSEHPYGGNTGFVTWLEDKDGNGYWLSYIDANTGNVVRPR